MALSRGRLITVDRLIDYLWPEDEVAPHRLEEQVALLVSRLRAVLGPRRVRADSARGCEGWGWGNALTAFLRPEDDLGFGDRSYHGATSRSPSAA